MIDTNQKTIYIRKPVFLPWENGKQKENLHIKKLQQKGHFKHTQTLIHIIDVYKTKNSNIFLSEKLSFPLFFIFFSMCDNE